MDEIEEKAIKDNIAMMCEIGNFQAAAGLLMRSFVVKKLTKEQLEPIPDIQDKLALFLSEGTSDVYGVIDLVIELAQKGQIKSRLQ